MGLPLFKILTRFTPGLSGRLVQAGVLEKPEFFVKKSLFVSFYITTFVLFGMAIIFIKFQIVLWLLIVLFPFLFLLLFLNFVKRPDFSVRKKMREFDSEIVFAGKFLIIELHSGVPVYNAMISVSKSYPVIGKYFREIINRVNVGTPIEDAINESIELTPSQNFRKLLWQMYNSLKTGADLAPALQLTVEQIAAEQMIQVKEYGRKLNPLVMFYMVVAVIFPSIGIIMLIVFSSFFSLSLNLTILMIVAAFVAFMQLIFLNLMRSQRPAVGID